MGTRVRRSGDGRDRRARRGAGAEEGHDDGTDRARVGTRQGRGNRTHCWHNESAEPEGDHRCVTALLDRDIFVGPADRGLGADALDVKLDEEEVKYLEEPYQPTAIFGH